MKKLLHILFLMLVAAVLSAQAPGYLGKRLYVKADAHLSISPGPTVNNRGRTYYFGEEETSGDFAIDTRFNLHTGFAYSRLNAVTVSIGYLKTGMAAEAYTPVLNPFNQSNTFDSHELFYNLKGIPVAIGHQKFLVKKGAIAPIGAYALVSLQATFLKGDIIDKRTNGSDNGEPIAHTRLGTNPKFTYWSAGFEYGRNTLFKDKLLVNYACFFNLPLQLGKVADLVEDGDTSDYPKYNQDNFEENAFFRMVLHGYFGFRIGVGLFVK
jgi:hypothetical protein